MNNLLRDSKSKAYSLWVSTRGALKEAKEFEQLLLILFWNTNSCVCNTDPYEVLFTGTLYSNGASCISKFECIWKQIKYYLKNSLVICVNHLRFFCPKFSHYRDSLSICFVLLNGDHFPNSFVHIKPLLLLPKFTVLHLCKVKEILCQAQHNFGRGVLKPKAFVKFRLDNLKLIDVSTELNVP